MPNPNHAQNPPLSNELRILRSALRTAKSALKNDPTNPEKAGLLIARLTNSISRLTLAQQKLLSSQPSDLEAEFDATLRAMGLGELDYPP